MATETANSISNANVATNATRVVADAERPRRTQSESAAPATDAVRVAIDEERREAAPTGEHDASRESLQKAAERFEAAINENLEVRFSVRLEEGAGEGALPNRITFKVVDTDTGRVVRQFPPEELLDLTERIEKGGSLILKSVA